MTQSIDGPPPANDLREKMSSLGFPDNLLQLAVSSFNNVEEARAWIQVTDGFARRREYLFEIRQSGLRPDEFARLREVGLSPMGALRLPKQLAATGLGVDEIVRWHAAQLGPRLTDAVRLFRDGLTLDELINIVAEEVGESESQRSAQVDRILALYNSGLSIDEFRQLNARGFSLDEIYSWRRFRLPADQWAAWKALGVAPEGAVIYQRSGATPDNAAEWIRSGISAEDAGAFIRRGLQVDIASRWVKSGYSGPDAVSFIDRGLGIEDAQQWAAGGLSAADAIAFIDRQLSIDEANEWKGVNLPIPTALAFLDKGITPNEALEFDRRGVDPDQLVQGEAGLEVELLPWQVDPVEQLPDVVEPGPINLTLWSTALGGGPVAYDVSFNWDGRHLAEWREDISMVNDDLSFASSAPVWGVAAWPRGRDVQLTYQWPDLGKLGYDKLTGVAPIVD
ncbi:hypothetical protein ABQF26_00935, partial [Mycolicibacterium elephantis]